MSDEERAAAAEESAQAGLSHMFPNAQVGGPTVMVTQAPLTPDHPDWPRFRAQQSVIYLERERETLAERTERAGEAVVKAQRHVTEMELAAESALAQLDALDEELADARARLDELSGEA